LIEGRTRSPSEIHVGIHVALASSGGTVFGHNESKPFIPASNLKIVTSACALDLLGPDYRFNTDFLSQSRWRQDGLLDGDLVLRGFGDPTLADLETVELWKTVPRADKAYGLPHGLEITLESIVQKLHRLGLREIAGDILIDDSFFDDKRVADGWTTDDEPWFYGSQVGALSLNENILTVVVNPSPRAGDPGTVKTAPPTSYVRVTNETTTTGEETTTSLLFTRSRAQNEIIVKGSIACGHKSVVKFMTVEDPGLYIGHVLREVLCKSGIPVSGLVRRRRVNERMQLLLRNRSAPLSSIVYYLNKASDNFYAEMLLKTMGAVAEKDGSWEGGLKVIQRFLRRQGIRSGYRIADGSGLSRYNLLTPRVLTTILRNAWRNSNFVDSLPVAGRDKGYGTLWRRMKNTAAAGNLRAKTGTVEGVSTLSGYVNSLDNRTLVFSIMTNGIVGGAKIGRDLQDRVGIVLASNRLADIPAALRDICTSFNPKT
jgi:PBP4 family serine-type D-alanyl-D-alanine carboxypeptidase